MRSLVHTFPNRVRSVLRSAPAWGLLMAAMPLVGLLPTTTPAAFAKGPAYTDPQAAGADFQIQGEYRGEIIGEDREETWGAQVIALGDGKFQLNGFKGGLPGDGWSRGDETQTYQGAIEDGSGNRAVFDAERATLEIADGKLAVIVDGNTLATLEKVERESPTLGKEPPAGATVLFDGSSVDAWESAKLVDEKWLGATNAVTREKFGDHSLHVEFRTPFMPHDRGQARGNSGVYIQGRYELQVLDSFGLEGKNNECGGIYTIAEPAVNMCFPPLAWQTYDIDFTAARYDGDQKTQNARVTIRHNGVLIHDDLELPSGTPGFRPEGPGDESLFLQDHGDPVVFRNIWVVTK